MNFETGENYIDLETGEIPDRGLHNSETGELELVRKQPRSVRKRPFKIPSSYLVTACAEKESESRRVTKKIIFTNSNPLSPALIFLLPSVFLFLPITALVLSALEMILHAWAHKKNNLLRNNNIHHVYYQSPMHGLVEQFCSTCRYELAKDAIEKLQDKWNNRRFIKYGIECVKQVA